ncbi:MAG TPA: hypothetical protein VFU16_03245 [Solirubrobacterales bacterium]|nr:hypothetical protein [Solirubrobacterales bacterium]
MNNQRRLAIAIAAIACFALAVPALAQAAVWKHKGVNLAKFVEFSLPGGEIFETEIEGVKSGMSCEVRAVMTTEGGSTAKINKYETKSCTAAFGKMTGCSVNTQEAKGLPWTVDVKTNDLAITNMRVKRTFKAGCVVAEYDKTFAEMTVNLNAPTAITEMEFNGTTGGYKAYGSWTVEGLNSGTYGIG